MTTLAIDSIHESPDNARRVVSDEMSDNALRVSLEALGMLQPILVRPNGDGFTVVAGNRRLAAARALGWSEVPVVELVREGKAANAPTAAMSAAENLVRKPMHPVDAWRVIRTLVDDHDYTVQGAADALGLPLSLARRLKHLSAMATEVVDALANDAELPNQSVLRTVSMAPHDVQRAALARATRKDRVDWWAVAQRCETIRIPATRAIFDRDTANVRFDEDLFAQPDDDDRFSTSDIDGFLKAQRTALADKAAASKGRMTVLPFARSARVRDRMPRGWNATFDKVPKRFRKDDPRHVYATVVEEGFAIGEVEYVVAAPKVERPSPASADIATETVREKPPMTKITFDRLAILKRQAVVERLPLIAANENPSDFLRALLLCLTFENVALWDSDRRYGTGPYRDLARKLINDDGKPIDLSETELCTLAADAIGRMVKFEGQDSTNASGQQAEWLAAMVGAEMPRCDTEEILKGVSKDKLIELARAHGIDESGRTSDIRARLVGHLPDWKPVDFGAKGPHGYHFERDTDDASDNQSDTAEEEQEEESVT